MDLKKTFLIFLIFIFASLVFADATIAFQGRLLDSYGSPINGVRYFCFKVWADATNTNPSYLIEDLPTPTKVTCQDGNYAIPITLDENEVNTANVYLEIYVSTDNYITTDDEKLSPRLQLKSVPYTIVTHQIQNLDISRNASEMIISY